MRLRPTRFCLALLPALLLACPTPTPGGDDGGPDAGAPDAGEVEDDGRVAKESRGAFLGAVPKDVLVGVSKPVAVVALQTTIGSALWFGGEDAFKVFAGLAVVDTSSGAVRLYDSDDGLPTHHYFDEFNDYGVHTTSTFDLAWVREDEVFAATGFHHVIRGAVDDAGVWGFTSAPLRAPGKTEDATLRAVAVLDGELWVTTDQGVAVVDGGTLAVKRWAELGVSVAGPWVDRAVPATLGTGAVVATFGPENRQPNQLVVLRTLGAPVVLSVAEGEVPLSLATVPGGVVVGLRTAAGGALDLLTFEDGAVGRKRLIGDDGLLTDSGTPVIPKRLAFDPVRSRLVVGGMIVQGGAGGSGFVELSLEGGLASGLRDVVDRREVWNAVIPWQFETFVFDGSGRLWLSGMQLCSESKFRAVGLLRLERSAELRDPEVRLVRPVISGVRSRTIDPVDGHLWLGLRDENAGLNCEGVVSQQHVCRLKADGSCELWTPRLNTDTKPYSVNLGASAIAFGNPDRKEMAIATRRDATWVRIGDETRELSTQIDPGLSLDMTAAAFGEDGSLWLASEMTWSAFPGMDEVAINQRGPQGLGLLEFAGNSTPTATRRYTRVISDINPERQVGGLPSSTVWDVAPLPGTRRALVACGVERDDSVFDHLLAPPNARDLRGGIAVVEDKAVTILSPPPGTRFGDVTALAPSDGKLYAALDAALGVFDLDLVNHATTLRAAAPWTDGERGLSLSFAPDGTFAVGTTRALRLHDGAGWRTLDDTAGFVWKVGFEEDGTLWAATDAGYRRYRLRADTVPALSLPSGPLPRDPWPLFLGCNGEQSCACGGPADCAPGLDCYCVGESCACGDTPPCTSDADCDEGETCNPRGACEAPPNDACADDCTCDTANGCPAGMRCQGGFAGFDCVPE